MKNTFIALFGIVIMLWLVTGFIGKFKEGAKSSLNQIFNPSETASSKKLREIKEKQRQNQEHYQRQLERQRQKAYNDQKYFDGSF